MHKEKLLSAFSNFPFDDITDCDIELFDWSCGQGMASMVLLEYLKDKEYKLRIRSVTLSEPSEIALKRASLHVRHFNKEVRIKTVLKDMDCF